MDRVFHSALYGGKRGSGTVVPDAGIGIVGIDLESQTVVGGCGICLGENNSSMTNDFWKFDGTTWTQLRDIADTNDDEDYDDDYAIVRSYAVSFVIDGKGYIATGGSSSGSVSADYWVYYPETDLWYGDSDDDYTPLTEANSGGSSRSTAVSFSTGTKGFVLTGESGGTYFDDIYQLFPYEMEEAN